MDLVKTLRQPYPLDPPAWNKVRMGASIGLFVFLFLFLFQPFGMDRIESNKALHIGGYGLMTFLVVLLLDVLLPRIWTAPFNESKWTVGKEMVYFLANLTLIALANMLYTAAMGYSSISFTNFIMFFVVTVMVGIFPTVTMIMVAYNRKLKKAVREAKEMNEELHSPHAARSQSLLLQGENQHDRIACNSAELLAITSADNYLDVWLAKEGGVSRQVIRGSLSQMEAYLSDKGHFMRVHRSHLVNMDRVMAVDGNAQGYQLKVHDEVPWLSVSRRQGKALREVIYTLA